MGKINKEVFDQLAGAVCDFTWSSDKCVYCGSTGRFQLDHFPIPKAAGGKLTVRACLHCHNMKDRVSESMAWSMLESQAEAVEEVVLSDVEIAFLVGAAYVLPSGIVFALDDFDCFPASIKILLARRLRQQFMEMSYHFGPVSSSCS